MNRYQAAAVTLLLGVGLMGGLSAAARADGVRVDTVPAVTPAGLGRVPTPPKFDPKTAKVVPVPDLTGKVAPPNPALARKTLTSGFKYAGQIRQQADMAAVSTNSWIDKPLLDGIDHHTLAEIAIHGNDGRSILEVGWVVNNDALFPATNSNPHLFGSAWYNSGTGSVWCGSYVGGCGYVDYSGNATNLGADLIGVRSLNKQFQFQYDAPSARWWIRYDMNWIGSWPAALNHTAQTPAFDRANLLQSFGEVAYAHYPTCTDMGSGFMAVAGGTAPTSGAIFTTLNTSIVGTGVWNLVDYTSNVTAMTDPTKYGLVDTGTGQFKYGGPGSSPSPGACP